MFKPREEHPQHPNLCTRTLRAAETAYLTDPSAASAIPSFHVQAPRSAPSAAQPLNQERRNGGKSGPDRPFRRLRYSVVPCSSPAKCSISSPALERGATERRKERT